MCDGKYSRAGYGVDARLLVNSLQTVPGTRFG